MQSWPPAAPSTASCPPLWSDISQADQPWPGKRPAPGFCHSLTVPRVALLGITVIAFAHSWTGLARRLRGVDLSYGIYLYHMPFIATLHYGGVMRSAWLWPVVFTVPMACASLSWFLVERPALKLKPKADALIARVRLRGWRESHDLGEAPAAN